MKTIVLTGGGTAGHVIPNLALVPYLDDFEVHYIGGKSGIEKNLVKDLPFHGITTGKLRRSLSPSAIIKNCLMPFQVLKGISSAKRHLRRIKPDIVFSKGGFVAYPVVRAAASLGIPVIVHESDLSIGLANRMSLKFATTILTSFDKTAKAINGVHTGSPIRQELKKGLQSPNSKNLVIMGGSLGSTAINNAITTELCDNWNIIHITGRGKKTFVRHQNYKQIEYSDDIATILGWADIVVSRAGSGAVFELLALEKPMILVPLNTGRGDQIENAHEVASWDAALYLPEEKLHTLNFAAETVYKNREKYISNIRKLEKIDGTKQIAQIIKTL